MRPKNTTRRSLTDRFWEKVDRSGECWIWTASRNPDGYGKINSGGRHGPTLRAHRVSYELAYGPIPEGLDVCHRCDNPPCVNPAHLFVGTPLDNMQDAVQKGHVHNGDRHYTHREPSLTVRGEQKGTAKLTNEQVREIRHQAHQGFPQRAIAKQFGVQESTISMIVRRRLWKHLDPPSSA